MAVLSALYPLVRRYVRNCLEPAMDDAIRYAQRQFCSDSKFLRETIVLSIEANARFYNLVPLTPDTEVIEVKAIQLGEFDTLAGESFEDVRQSYGPAENWIFEPPSNLWFVPTPTEDALDEIAARSVLTTIELAATIPDPLMRKFDHTIADGAIAHLKAMSGASWFDPKMVDWHQQRFLNGISLASADAGRTHRSRNFRVRTCP